MALLDDIFGPGTFLPGSLMGNAGVNLDDPEALRRLLETMGAPPAQSVGTSDVLARMNAPAPVSAFPQGTVTREPAPAPAQEAPAMRQPSSSVSAPREVTFLDRLGALARGYKDGGLIGGIADAAGGVDRTVETENRTIQALRQRGLDENTARVVARNPQLLQQFLAPNQGATFGVIGEDQFGGKRYGWINPRTQTTTPSDASGGGGTPPQNTAAGNPTLTGAEYLATLPQAQQGIIQQIAEGRAPYPTGQILRTPYGQRLQTMLSQYDPTLDATTWGARNSTRRDFASGASSRNVRALNTVAGHLDTLDRSIDDLGNFETLPLVNQPVNAVRGQFSPEFQQAQSRFNTARSAVASELMRVFREVGASTTEIQHWERMMESTASPVALREGVRTAIELINSRLSALNDTYNRGMGTSQAVTELLSPESRAIYERLSGRRGQNAAPPPAADAPGAPPAAGARPAPPSGVPAAADYSPSRRQWRDSQGRLYDAQGKRLGTQ